MPGLASFLLGWDQVIVLKRIWGILIEVSLHGTLECFSLSLFSPHCHLGLNRFLQVFETLKKPALSADIDEAGQVPP